MKQNYLTTGKAYSAPVCEKIELRFEGSMMTVVSSATYGQAGRAGNNLDVLDGDDELEF